MSFNKIYLLFSIIFAVSIGYGQETFRDNFSSVSYSNNDGTQNWATDWIENGDTNLGPTAQYIYINGNRLNFYYLFGENIRRTANLSGASTATLSFNWQTTGLSGGKAIIVQASNNGGASYTTIASMNGNNSSGTINQSITAYISSNTTIRFSSNGNNWDNNDYAYIDNVQIQVDQLVPTLFIDDVTVNESDGLANFTVVHNGAATSGPFTVNYTTSNGTATAGIDYETTTGTLNFSGSSGDSEIISVPILDDTELENLETFTVQMTSASNYAVNISDTAIATITDNDAITMTNGTTSNECDMVFLDPGRLGNYANNLNVTHTLCPSAGTDYVSVDFTSFDVANFDFLNIYDGNSTGATLIGQYNNSNVPKTITASPGGSGCLTFRFTSNNNSTGTGFQANIKCSVEGPRLVIDDVFVDEDAGTAVFTVTSTRVAHGRNIFLLGFVNTQFSVNYTTTNGSALAGSDYNTTTGTLTFNGAIGNQRTISVPITNDGVPEFDENFFIEFISVNAPDANVNIDDTGVGTINSQILSNVPLTLFKQFDGDFDYTTTGGSLRTQSNSVNPCTIQASSSNRLVSPIPNTGSVQAAYLYWAHSSYVRDEQVTFEGQTVNASSVYQTTFNASGTNLSFFGYVSDVTDLVQNIDNINTNDFDFSDLTIDTSNNFCATATVLGGWSLIVFYEDPNLPAVNINLYQGFDGLQNSGTSFTLDSFFAIAGAGAKSTFLSWEGDFTLDGNTGTNPEALSITNQGGNTFNLTGDGGNPGNNSYNSTIYDNTTTPIYNLSGIYGLDLDTYDISSFITPGDSQVTANVDVGQDYIINNAVVIKVPSNLITGTVFEDLNYPGGNGRNQATSSGISISGAIVELFESNGTFLERKNTNVNGDYTFAGMEDGDYLVKVVNSSVRSTRGGGLNCTVCFPVQTYRNFGDANLLIDVTTEIGGADPSATQDAALGILTDAQSVSEVSVASNGVAGVDFGFNFNTIVNTNEDGQGSLEQFIINSNNLEETGLNIEANSIFDPASGEDTSIFMIPPTGDALGRSADTNFSGGYFDILIANGNPLSVIAGTTTHIDGRTQTAYSGNTNSGTVGSGGSTVGTSANTLPIYDLPEIQIHKNNGDVLRLQGINTTIRNISVFANNNAGIQVLGGSSIISNTLLGVSAFGLNAGNIDYGIEIIGGSTIIDGNYIATNTDAGIVIDGGTSTIIQNNHITTNGDAACDDNITITNGSGIVIQQNLIENAASLGIDGDGIPGNVGILGNTIIASGQNGGSCNGNIENAGIRLDGSDSSIINNIIASNGGAGIVLAGGNTSGNLISQNAIYANGTISPALGIDIDVTDGFGDGVTINDGNDSDNGPNGALNFPVLSGAYISGTNLIIEGWARPNTTVEIFLTDINEGTATAGDNQLGNSTDYGEGQTFLGTFVEGSALDTNSTTSSYLDEDGNTDNTNKFKFNLALPSGVTLGDFITTTATLGNSTSEFSPISILKVYTVITNRRITYRVGKN